MGRCRSHRALHHKETGHRVWDHPEDSKGVKSMNSQKTPHFEPSAKNHANLGTNYQPTGNLVEGSHVFSGLRRLVFEPSAKKLWLYC